MAIYIYIYIYTRKYINRSQNHEIVRCYGHIMLVIKTEEVEEAEELSSYKDFVTEVE